MVTEIHTAPKRTKVSQRADTSTGHTSNRVRNADLPPNTTNGFAKEVLPLAYETAGVLGPWECPDDEEIICIWNMVFGSDHPIAGGDVKDGLFLTVKTLVRCAVYYLLILFTIICPGQAWYISVASQICYRC